LAMYKDLQERIQVVSGYRVGSPRDCIRLSEDIFSRTGRSVSPTTLRRFFGLLKSKSNLSRYNLDTLALFAGYTDFGDFLHKHHKEVRSIRPELSQVLLEMEQITDFTLNSIIHKSLTTFRDTIARGRVNEMLNGFMESGKMLMPLVAPGGYGKSVSLAHWVRELKRTRSPACYPLFCSASLFYKMLQPLSSQAGCITLSPGEPGNIFRQFEYDKTALQKPLLLIIDGMDEIEEEVTKILTVISAILDITSQYRRGDMLRIILAARVITWNKYIYPELSAGKPEWLLYSEACGLDHSLGNMPVLSGTELRELLKGRTFRDGAPVVFDCIHWELKQLIRIPINLHFFQTVADSHESTYLNSELLMKHYLDNQVFNSRFGEEKSDLIWHLVREYMKSGPQIPKSRVRQVYPIHLKREANYYLAYNKLLSDGILQEERVENAYGLYTTHIVFSHTNILYYLTALYFVRMNDGFDGNLLQKVSTQKQSLEWKANILANLFQMAYARERFGALKDFCMIDPEILSTLPVRQAVGNAFRRVNGIRDKLVEAYASHPAGQEQFFEMFVDTNYLFSNFSSRIRIYLMHKHTLEAKMFGHGILFLSEFLRMNKMGCVQEIAILKELEPDASVHPWPVGRKVGNTLLFHEIVEGTPLQDPGFFILEYTKLAYMYPGYLEKGAIEFEMMILLALTLAGKFELVERVGGNISDNYNLTPGSQAILFWRHQYQNAFAQAYIDFARSRKEGRVPDRTAENWESLLDSYRSVFDDFQNMIMVHYFLYEHYLSTGIEDRARYHLESAMEISRFAGYRFFEAFLLMKGASLDRGYYQKGLKLIKDSGFNPKADCFSMAQ
jgi:hypothetical protein